MRPRYGIEPSASASWLDLQRTEAPRAERKRLELEVQHVLKEPILNLQMLRAKKGALRPDDRLQSLHLQSK